MRSFKVNPLDRAFFSSFFFKKFHLSIFFLIESFFTVFFFNFIFQYLIDFELVFIICFGLFSMRSSQPQINIQYFDWCSILQMSIFVIISISKKYFKKIVKPNGIHDLGREFNKLSYEARVNPICHHLNIYIYIYVYIYIYISS